MKGTSKIKAQSKPAAKPTASPKTQAPQKGKGKRG